MQKKLFETRVKLGEVVQKVQGVLGELVPRAWRKVETPHNREVDMTKCFRETMDEIECYGSEERMSIYSSGLFGAHRILCGIMLNRTDRPNQSGLDHDQFTTVIASLREKLVENGRPYTSQLLAAMEGLEEKSPLQIQFEATQQALDLVEVASEVQKRIGPMREPTLEHYSELGSHFWRNMEVVLEHAGIEDGVSEYSRLNELRLELAQLPDVSTGDDRKIENVRDLVGSVGMWNQAQESLILDGLKDLSNRLRDRDTKERQRLEPQIELIRQKFLAVGINPDRPNYRPQIKN